MRWVLGKLLVGEVVVGGGRERERERSDGGVEKERREGARAQKESSVDASRSLFLSPLSLLSLLSPFSLPSLSSLQTSAHPPLRLLGLLECPRVSEMEEVEDACFWE